MPQTVYVVQHVVESADGSEDIKFIGVYESAAEAEAATARLCLQPGFRDHQEGFHIGEYILGEDHWTEGFISWEEASSDPRTP